MKAVLVSLPLVGVVLGLIDLVRMNEERLLVGRTRTFHEIIVGTTQSFSYSIPDGGAIMEFTLIAPYIFGAVMVALLLIFACKNHFLCERGSGQLARQLVWLLALSRLRM
jgi:hypothetical protein